MIDDYVFLIRVVTKVAALATLLYEKAYRIAARQPIVGRVHDTLSGRNEHHYM